ncbi:MAG: hypothetical protein K6D38_07725 [Pseudobutyrivibrio sp.]|nr:hypothetical protein [Pseudobutyrivibrio sp.]
MIYDFMTIKDDIEVTHTEVRSDDTVRVYFQKPIESGGKSIECVIPELSWENNKGFNDEELKYLEDYVDSVKDIIIELAQKGGFASLDNESGFK